MLKMLSFKLLLLAVALGFFEGDAKFGERSEGSGARRRRCLNGNPPKRLKRRDRRMMSQLELLSGGEMLCGGFYPRLSCCLRSDSPGLGRLDHKVGTRPPHPCEIGWVGFPAAPATLVSVRRAKLVWAVHFNNFSKALARFRCVFLRGAQIPLPPPRVRGRDAVAKLPVSEKTSFCGTRTQGGVNILKESRLTVCFGSNRALAVVKL